MRLLGLVLSLTATAYASAGSSLREIHPSRLGSRQTCYVSAHGNGTDDAPAILDAFQECGQGGRVIFSNTTYHIATVMNTTNLKDCHVDMWGTLQWSDDLDYWLDHSMSVGFQNQSTVWFFGGERVTFNGYGVGTLDGNGQAWYDLVNGESNYPHRPMGITWWNLYDSDIAGVRFIQSQMWTMAIMHSSNVVLSDIYINSTSHSDAPSRNTDGADTVYAHNITFRNWVVDNGDDAIAVKQNSTQILVENSTFYTGQGFALGSIGQYDGEWEVIDNIVVRNITCVRTTYAAYVKTWTGDAVGYPPNGGGGGRGYVRNVIIENFSLIDGESEPISFSQCTSYQDGDNPDCESSKLKISDITVRDIKGEVDSDTVVNLACSEAADGCDRIAVHNVRVTDSSSSSLAKEYLCTNVNDPIGFNCTGPADDNGGS